MGLISVENVHFQFQIRTTFRLNTHNVRIII
nr:MAG TPA: hypothetical protein [Caudoviricetes sp.]